MKYAYYGCGMGKKLKKTYNKSFNLTRHFVAHKLNRRYVSLR